ncbi:porin family protein [Mangrovimonas spongiae]|uniref:PorT family protein n=1 Tax=Mangrovimonas spongiae TaxID=2494697 RepID=A0A428JZ19_9FLAO|nr:outer membrane beta-barrel protein [Mangrovimonas spongiae]RSK39366.1 PorT family protein [Mangrovimonas spongiae]
MKHIITTIAFTFAMVFFVNGQNKNGIGFKGGINYNANGDYFESVNQNAKTPDRNIGYHFGLFGKVGNKLFIKPELVYTKTKSDYDDASFDMQKLDAPVLVGINFLNVFNAFAGPSFQYILDTEFDGINIDNVENDFSVGINFGFGVSFNKVGIDLRYERGFSDNEATFIDDNLGNGIVSRIDTRPDQLILSLSLLL